MKISQEKNTLQANIFCEQKSKNLQKKYQQIESSNIQKKKKKRNITLQLSSIPVGKRSSIPSPGDLPNPGIEPRSPALQGDSLPVEPQGKPKNTGVGSLSLLQGIFLTQELNWGLLHCRRILYQLSYHGSNPSGARFVKYVKAN